jgi:GTP-binding protein EngB required for normal cell division
MAAKSVDSLTQTDLAHQVLRSNLSNLVAKLQSDDIADDLYSNGLISEDEYALAIDDDKKKPKVMRKIIFSVLKKVKSNYQHFETFCAALDKSDTQEAKECARKLRDELQSLENENKAINTNYLKSLKEKLSVMQTMLYESDENTTAKHEVIKDSITTFIKDSLVNLLQSEISEQLHHLCYTDMLIPPKLIDWTFDILKELSQPKEEVSDFDLKDLSSDEESSNPFLLSSEVNNCLVLCEMLSSCDHKDYTKFLDKLPHSFEEVSFSRPPSDLEGKLQPYVIARIESTKMVYVAFLGESDVNAWANYTSLNEEISTQSKYIPIRFFVEQIQSGYSIVFTGFSVGGLLAMCVYGSIWNENSLNPENLQQSVFCVTFGTPIISLKELENSVPGIEKNNHFYIMKDDIMPRLLESFRDIYDLGNPDSKEEFTEPQKFLFELKAAVLVLLISLSKIDINSKTGKPLSDDGVDISGVKNILMKKHDIPKIKIFGTCQFLCSDRSKTTITQLAPKASLDVLRMPTFEELDKITNPVHLITMHLLSKYKKALYQAYNIDQQPHAHQKIQEISILRPDAKSIKFYRHGDEVAVVLEGNNLWFCSRIEITTKSGIQPPINTLEDPPTCHAINFNYPPKHDQDLLIARDETTVKIVIYSHFANDIKIRKLPAEIMGEYLISQRERQLASCTPGNIIFYSFLSTLLEQTLDEKPSRRYTTIRQFFDNAVSIVPVESVGFAIGIQQNEENAWKCAYAFTEYCLSTERQLYSLQLTQCLNFALSKLTLLMPGVLASIQEQIMHYIQSGQPHYIVPGFNVQIPVNPDIDGTGRSFSDVIKGKPPQSQKETKQLQNISIDKPTVINTMKELTTHSVQYCNDQIKKKIPPRFISGISVQVVYQTDEESSSHHELYSLKSVLKKGREVLNDLRKNVEVIEQRQSQHSAEIESSKTLYNEEMILTISKIINTDLNVCISILSEFMEQQISIPLVNSPKDTAYILQAMKAPPSIGVWGLFSLRMIDFEEMVRTRKGKALYVKVDKYIRNIISQRNSPEERYTGKLQFLMHCLKRSVSCSQQYISYSLEMQLAELCQSRGIKSSTKVGDLINDWDRYFKKNLLRYVYRQHRPLVARWILWCLNIHNLRKELASHTTVGVIGLSNSGKSSLVKSLFKLKTVTGITNIQRTTVPFLYNLDGMVDGLSVIDFPGADDKNPDVIKLTEIFLRLPQLVILVIEFKSCNTESANKWIEILRHCDVPVLVCLTHGDVLYATNCIDENNVHWPTDKAKRFLHQQLEETRSKLNLPKWKVELFSFCQNKDSTLNTDEGRQILKDVGVFSCDYVGEWIENELSTYMKETDLAERLHKFRTSTKCSQKERAEAKAIPNLFGLNVYGEEIFFVTQEGIEYTWQGHGLKIWIPPNAISDETCHIYVKVISSGHYELPNNTILLSPLYFLYSPKEFLKKVQVNIQHCGVSHATISDNLFFIHGECDQKAAPPYTFKSLQGSFSSNSQEGIIFLDSFSNCLVGIVSEYLSTKSSPNYIDLETNDASTVQLPNIVDLNSDSSTTPLPNIVDLNSDSSTTPLPNIVDLKINESSTTPSLSAVNLKKINPSSFIVKVFVEPCDSEIYNIHLIFIKDLESLHTKVMEEHKGWQLYVEEQLELNTTSGEISIEVEKSELNGWKCTKKNSCKIAKHWLEGYQPEKSLPKCSLEIRWLKSEDSIPIDYPFLIKGAVNSPTLTISLPVAQSKTPKRTNIVDDHRNERINPHEYPKSYQAFKLLSEAKFCFEKSFQKLMGEMGLEFDDKMRLHRQFKHHNDTMAVEEAIDWWIKNESDPTWHKFVMIVRKCEPNTAEYITNKF